jgi:hypothetical protein
MPKIKRIGYLAAYAQHAGITQAAASKQLKKIGIDYMKPFSHKEADERVKASYKPQHANKRRRQFPNDPPPPPTIDTPPTPGKDFTPIVTQPGTYLDAQRRKELASAALKELDVRQRSGELIEVAVVEKTLFNRSRQTRDALLSLADRLAGILAPITDQTKVHELLTAEMHQALEALTEPFTPEDTKQDESALDDESAE